MAAGYDGSVRIKAMLNHSNFDSGVLSMISSIKRLGGTLTKLAGIVGAAFSTAAIINFGRESIKAASDLSNAWIGLQNIMEGQGRSFNRAKSFIEDYISDGLVPLENAVTAYKNLAMRGYDTSQIEQLMNALKDSAAFGRQPSYTLGQAVQTATEGLKNENSILVDNAGVTKNVAKMWEDYAKSIGVSVQSLTTAQKRQAEVNGILEESRFQTGDAAKLTTTYSGQLAQLSANFQNLKVEVGNALIPIAQNVLPAINAIISALIELAQVFAKVSELIFGKKNVGTVGAVGAQDDLASSGLNAAGAEDKLADATAGAGSSAKKAAKDMKGVIASFDELNILADNTASSLDGASGGLSDIGASIPEESWGDDIWGGEVEESFKSAGEALNHFLDQLLNEGIPKVREAFEQFAKEFNGINQKIYDALTFPGVQDKIGKLGTELASALNDLVSGDKGIDWELWGKSFGIGIQTGINFLVHFVREFDSVALGNALGEWVSGAISEIHWNEVGYLLWKRFGAAIETAAGFITGLDADEVSKAITDFVTGFFNAIKDTFDKVDGQEIGKKIADILNGIDWNKVISSAWGALKSFAGTVIATIAGFIENADPDTLLLAFGALALLLAPKIAPLFAGPIASKISSAISGKLASLLPSSIPGAISSLGTLALGAVAVTATLAAVVHVIINWDKLKDEAKSIGEGIRNLFVGDFEAADKSFTRAFLDWMNMDGIVADLNKWITDALFGAGTWDNAKAALENGTVTLWDTIHRDTEANLNDFLGIFTGALGQVNKETDGKMGETVQIVNNKLTEIASNTAIHLGTVQTTSKNTWDAVHTDSERKWGEIQTGISKSVDGIKTKVSDGFGEVETTVTDSLFNVETTTEEKWSNTQKSVSDNVDGIKTKVRDGLTEVVETSSTKWEELRGETERKVEEVGSAVESGFDNVKKTISDKLEDAKNEAKRKDWTSVGKNIGDGIADGIESSWSNVSKSISGIARKIENAMPRYGKSASYSSYNSSGYSARYAAVSAADLPRLANGAVIPPNQQFAAILGDQRGGTNIEAPLATIKQAVTEAMQAVSGISGSQPIQVNVILDRKTIGTAVINDINSRTRSAGRSPLLGMG